MRVVEYNCVIVIFFLF